jgi:predicted transglutaminase-like cysteine proteinase
LAKRSRGKFFARFSCVVIFAAALLYGAGAAHAAQKNTPGPAAKPAVVAMMPGSPAAQNGQHDGQSARQPAGQSAPLARYFTINEVLANLDSQKTRPAASNRPAQVAALDSGVPNSAAAAAPPSAQLQGDEPFGLATYRAPEGLLWVKWRKLNSEATAEAQVLAQCRADPKRCTSAAAQRYLAMIEETRNLSTRAKIDRINRAVNSAVRYTSDLAQHGVPDLWTAPLATLSAAQGDCEDYAIAKYAVLRDAGISTDDLRLVLVTDRVAREHHAVVGVRHQGRWLMLDNRHDLLMEQKDVWHFAPLFALDREGVKLFAAPYGAAVASGQSPRTIEPASTARDAAGGNAANRNAADKHTADLNASGADTPPLRLDTFAPPPLRGRM